MFDRFDICEAFYIFASLHHGGQGSREFRIFARLERIGFRPRFNLDGPANLSPNARAIYDALAGDA